MSLDLRRFAKLPLYLRAFGPLAGLRLYAAIERAGLPVKSETVQAYAVPGYDAPVSLRRARADHATFWQCLVQRQYDLDRFPQTARLQQTYEAMLARGERPLIIDGGANIGLAALWLARRFPQAQIVSVEPDTGNLALLRRNLAGLGARAQVLDGGLWPRSGRLRIVNPESGSAAFRVEETTGDGPGTLRAYTIDEICTLAGCREPLIVKLDIEGAQQYLFASATEWVGRAHLITLELDDWLFPWRGSSRPFFRVLGEHPFDYLLGGESVFCFRDAGAAV